MGGGEGKQTARLNSKAREGLELPINARVA